MKRSTRRRRQSYVWARFFIVEFAPPRGEETKRRIMPSGTATRGFGTAVRWR